jgi:hypothetical protein
MSGYGLKLGFVGFELGLLRLSTPRLGLELGGQLPGFGGGRHLPVAGKHAVGGF